VSGLDRLREAWQGASVGDRSLFGFGALVAIGGLGYVLAWQPLDRDLATSESRARTAQTHKSWAQRTVDEIAGLKRSATTHSTSDPRAGVERLVSARGLREAMTSLDGQDGRVRLSFAAIEFGTLVALVETLGREEQLFAVEALLAARVEPVIVPAELTLARPVAR